jgi:abequosyltransferase
VVINREIWLQRNRAAYFGTNFIHAGVIFQAPFSGSIMMLKEPLITIRHGNASWTNKAFMVWGYKWPDLIWSFDHVSAAKRNLISPKDSGVSIKRLIYFRALGAITVDAIVEYNRVASSRLPAWKTQVVLMLTPAIANFVCGLYCLFFREKTKLQISDLAGSKFSNGLVRYLLRRSTI